jgi:hypothetical protein
MKSHRLFPLVFLSAVIFLPILGSAQGTLTYWVNPSTGSDSNSGSQSAPFQHIAYAWSVAQANNLSSKATIVNLDAGTYRESVTMTGETGATSSLVTFQPASGATGKVIWSGGTLYTGWSVYSGNSSIYTHAWTNDYPVCAQVSGCTSYLQPEIMLHQEMVTVNGSVLTQVLSLTQMLYPGTFYVDNTTSTIYVWPPSGTNMATATVDIPSQSALLTINNVSDLLFDGVIFQYANSCRSNAAVTVNSGSLITFNTDTFQWNNGQGIAINNPATDVTVENSTSNFNGDSGFQSSQTVGLQWTNNIAEDNNWRGAQGGYYACNVAGQHVWMAHGDTMTNDNISWNEAYGVHWDTDNRNDNVSGLKSTNNLLAGVFIEKDEGPIDLSASYVCSQTSSLSAAGFSLRNSGYDSNFNAVSPGVSLTGSSVYNNASNEIIVGGQAGGLQITDWQTGKTYNLITGNFTNTGNIIEGVGSTEEVFNDVALGGSDWADFQLTLVSNNNDWWNSSNTTQPFALPVPIVGTLADFATWQVDTLQDLIGSTFSAPTGTPFAACDAIAAPASDYWVTVDNNTVTAGPTGAAVYNLSFTSLGGFAGTINLSLDGITEVAGLSATLSQNPITGGSGTSVLTVTSTIGTTPAGSYNVTVIANSGNLTRTVTVQIVVPGASLLFSTLNVSFPNQQVNTTSAPLTVTITNKGTKTVTFTSYTMSLTQFAISKNTCPASGKPLGAGKNCTISITFTPSGVGTYSGTLTVVDGDVDSPQVVTLTGTGTTSPTVVLSTYNLAFGFILKNASSISSFTLTNTGSVNLDITSVTITGTDEAMFTQTNNCGSTVLPSGVCTFNVTFTPTNTALDTATLTIHDNTSAGDQIVSLSGTGALPIVKFTPTILAFGSVEIGSSSSLSDTVENSGEVPLTITKIALSGTNTQYYTESDNCPRSPSTLAAGATCVATLVFKPTVSGALNSSLTITDNVTAGSSTLSLTGTGKYPTVSFTPTVLAFGNVLVGSSSTLSDTVKNSGLVPLSITKIALSGTNTQYYTESDNCPRSPSTLAAGATCVATLVFKPTVSGALNSTLTITDNTSTGSSALSLTAMGKYPTVSFTPNILAFGSVVLDIGVPLVDTVTNTGLVPLTITKIAITGNNTQYYTEADTCPRSPSTLAAGATCVATVIFTPTIAGALNSTLTITDNTSTGSSTLSLTGSGQ